MKLQQLALVQQAIENFFYRIRVNIALHDILVSKEYREFKKKTRSAIETQVLFFAKLEKMNEVIGVSKADGDVDEGDILDNIGLLFPAFLLFVSGDDIKRYLGYSANRGGRSAYNILRRDGSYQISDKLQKTIEARVNELAGYVDDTTKKWLARTIVKGLREGLSNYEIAKLVRDQAKKISALRAEVIAENEAAVFLAEAQLEVYEESDVSHKKLITSRDERVCPICIADEEAGEIPLKDPFPSGKVFTPIHIGCRCFVLPVVQSVIPVEP